MRRERRGALGFALLALLAACATPPAPPPSPRPAPEAATGDGEDDLRLPCFRATRLEVYKSERILVVRCEGGGRRLYPLALSREPVGPKRSSGDDRTPEGDYHIAGPARPSKFGVFLPLDYPTPADAEIALTEGRISAATHAEIVAAGEAGRMPPQDTPLGGHVGFHGEGPRWRGWLDLDWTTGCFALRDEDADDLARIALPGTPVRIEP